MPIQFLLSMKQQIANMLANHIAEFVMIPFFTALLLPMT